VSIVWIELVWSIKYCMWLL